MTAIVGESIGEAALLILIIDDDIALQVLAAWGALRFNIVDAESESTIEEIAELLQLGESRVRSRVRKLVAAKAVIDGGISDLADRMLQTIVGSKLGKKSSS